MQSSPTGGWIEWLYPLEIPPGVVRSFAPEYTDTCCGKCSLNISEFRLYYFPDSTDSGCHKNQTFNAISTQLLDRRMQSIEADEFTAIVSGHTL